jgi:hypothetical protein
MDNRTFTMVSKSKSAMMLALVLSGCGGAEGGGEVAAPSSSVVVVPAAEPPAVTPMPVPTPTPTPATLAAPALLADVSLGIPDAVVTSTSNVANVHIRLSRPVDRLLSFKYLTANGTAIEGSQFSRTQGNVIFRPGEQDKVVTITTKGMAPGQYFSLNVGWTKNVPAVGGAVGKIQASSADAYLASVTPAYPLLPAAGISGRHQVFTSNFRGPVNPAGGNGVWRTRFDWGRWQSGNNEAAPYADATTDPGTNPHPIVDGYRTLRAEKVPTTDGNRKFAYSASMLSTHGWYSFKYGYVELRAKVSPENGVTPAFWLLPANGEWPPEIDIFEFFNGGPLYSTVHFKNDPKGTMEGVATDFTADGQWHTYALDWTPDWLITLVDGKEIHRRRNLFNQPMYIIVNTAVGLMSSGPPNADAQWHNDMMLDTISVYQ